MQDIWIQSIWLNMMCKKTLLLLAHNGRCGSYSQRAIEVIDVMSFFSKILKLKV